MQLAPVTSRTSYKLTIFVHSASACLTDHLSHGDGLICYTLLNELTKRGHRVFAYTHRDAVRQRSDAMTIRARTHRVPANSLAPWEHGYRADNWLHEIEREHRVDIVWRMFPYGGSCPTRPYTGNRPLLIGPLFYSWPKQVAASMALGRPRLGVGVGRLVAPRADVGWSRTLHSAALVLCATDALADTIRPQTTGQVVTLPVIVDPPADVIGIRKPRRQATPLKLLFVANLHPNKNPLVFCQTVEELRKMGVQAIGTILGDGQDRQALQQYCQDAGLSDAVHFAGRVPNDDVYRRLAEADCLISASFGEPYGRGIAEAMSVGAVPVCHRSGGPCDFVSDGVDGLLVDRLDGQAYARAIAESVADASVHQRMSEAARSKARQWQPQAVIDRLENALFDLI